MENDSTLSRLNQKRNASGAMATIRPKVLDDYAFLSGI
jgi:hypothetical protein